MSTQIIQGAKVYLNSQYISSDISALVLKMSADAIECTTLADSWKQRKPGNADFDMSMEGYVDVASGGIDSRLFASLGLSDVPVMIGVTTGLAGTPAYFFKALEASYSPGAKQGEMFAFSASAVASATAAVRGQIIHNTSRSASGNGTGYSVGAQPAGTRPHMQLQVSSFSASGGSPTLTVTVQAGVDAAFATPYTLGVFTVAADETAEHKALAIDDLYAWSDNADAGWTSDGAPGWGVPQTHTYFRAVYALSNVSAADFAVAVGFKQ